jgi:outer membrane protein assembly factor BamB
MTGKPIFVLKIILSGYRRSIQLNLTASRHEFPIRGTWNFQNFLFVWINDRYLDQLSPGDTMNSPPRKPLRLWPGIAILILQWLARFVLPVVVPGALYYGVIGGVLGGLLIVLWWAFFSRAPWPERVSAILLMFFGLFATLGVADKSIATGAQGMLLPLLAIPFLCLAFVGWAVASRHLPDGPRRATMVLTIMIACGVWALVRTGGLTANFNNDLHWRWTKTPEERLLAELSETQASKSGSGGKPMPAPVREEFSSATPAAKTREKPVEKPSEIHPVDNLAALPPGPAKPEIKAEWPGFRGLNRDDVIPGVRISTDWATSPPIAMWRRAVGPGWSSFAVGGDFLYTQEQRGLEEVVACYKLVSGQPVWIHGDKARFWESNGGAGPRGTPTLNNGRVYTFGATGILNALNATDGKVVWSRNAAADNGANVPQWGFASSPLVVGDLVIVAAAGNLIAYDIATGAKRWSGPAHGGSYSSPHLVTLSGIVQVLLLSEFGATSMALSDGALLWEYEWKGHPIVQPAVTVEGDIIISVSESGGIRRLAVTREPNGWKVEERWTSIGLKPYFNDFVLHKGYAFGFDGSILACIDLNDGSRRWKGGRYGNGQLVLLPDQDLLLVVTEEGELALVRATADQFIELARIQAIEGKTWNHPVLIRDILLLRNGQEMDAFRLSPEDR